MKPLPALRRGTLAAAMLALCACASTPPQAQAPATADGGWEPLRAALLRQDWAGAQPGLAAALRNDLRNGYLQFLYALTYDGMAREGNRAQLDMAEVGYDNALQFTPMNFWAQMMTGFLELERGRYDEAQDRFAAAALDQPARWEAFYGLGVASYYRGDWAMLRLASQRARQLAPEQGDALRLAAYAGAVEGDAGARGLMQAALREDGGEQAGLGQRRIEQLLAQNTVGETQMDAPAAAAPATPPADPRQMLVDVTIILSSVVDGRNRGVNLFDGLRLQYGYNNQYSRANSSSEINGVVGTARESARAITSQISIPQLNYNLNLFNDSRQYYGVIARPSLTAFLGRESDFFAGRTVNVAVSGINLGELRPIDVGVRLRLAPEAISRSEVRFRVEAARSFLSRENVGNFNQSLTMFRQSVQATSELAFGQTLILSALSESVNDNTSSQVPLAGDIPGLDLLLKNSSAIRREESLLILVTPSLPATLQLPGDPLRRQRNVEELMRLWSRMVDPGSDVGAIVRRLERLRVFGKPKRGDLPYRPGGSQALLREAIEENLALARQ
ncbi:hypothetical protein D0B54_23430 [Solimonas sp. K1W22B-7]|uniref:hypothetical protein n=1 Tax=Solimonas sp. K1W22B-7 TaxID=2303331 RepID=UPI000E336FD2|nr:hypothetical protein [Solimonas sp. K1W22B-7]AXQ31454.1 hypothetical protein D0B54_23430 [Solimonas sp. K1W22B-7]